MVTVEQIEDPLTIAQAVAGVYHSALSSLPDAPDGEIAREWSRTTLARHASREAFRFYGAFDDQQLIGFIYGYHGERGQYWEDWLHERLPLEVYEEWLGDHFALVEFHVKAERQGEGIGGRLYDTLIRTEIPYQRMVLTTRRGDTPARQFYEHRGWRLVWEAVDERFSLLGLQLPAPVPQRRRRGRSAGGPLYTETFAVICDKNWPLHSIAGIEDMASTCGVSVDSIVERPKKLKFEMVITATGRAANIDSLRYALTRDDQRWSTDGNGDLLDWATDLAVDLVLAPVARSVFWRLRRWSWRLQRRQRERRSGMSSGAAASGDLSAPEH